MAAYYKVEVSLGTNAVTVGVPSPQTVNVVLPLVGPAGPQGAAGAAGATGAQGPQGVPGTGLEVLTTQGDLLYQGASTGERLPIGTEGEVLKVESGVPAWGAAGEAYDQSLNTDDDVAFNEVTTVALKFSQDALLFDEGGTFTFEIEGTGALRVSNSAIQAEVPIQFAGEDAATNASTTRDNLGLGDSATADIGTGAGDVCAGDDARLSDSRTPISHTHGNLTNDGKIGTTANLPLKTGTNGVVEAGAFGTSAGTFCEGNDARLSDNRDPNLHAASHAGAGSDPITIENSQVSNFADGVTDALSDVVFPSEVKIKDRANNYIGKFRADDDSLTANRTYDLPNASGILALQGAITTSGLTQATARILGRTTASTGSVEEIQIGSGLSLSAGSLSATGGGGEVRSDFVSPYTYTGLADAGTSESTASWLIRRSEFDAGGSFVATLTASAVQWANRLTASYT